MTQEKNTVLTQEEQAEIAENMPALLEALEKGSPVALGWLTSWRSKRSVGEEAKEQAVAIRKEVAAAIEASGPEQGTLAQWCGFPTDMTRCSPFFPMNPKELGDRHFLRNYLITSANWGEIHYTGPQLSTYEEDALLALLVIMEQKNTYIKTSYFLDYETGVGEVEVCNDARPAFVTFKDNEEALPKTLTYKGPLLPLLRVMGYSRPNKKDYIRIIQQLELMTVAGVKLSISTGKTKSGKHRAPRITQMSAMLAGVQWDDKKKELTTTINPFFYETYMAGRVTLMDVAKRMSLKGAIAKALYRFVQSQQQPVFTCHFLTLADALNMDREQPAKTTRKRLREAIAELIRHGLLTRKSRFVEQDIVNLDRAMGALPERNQKKS